MECLYRLPTSRVLGLHFRRDHGDLYLTGVGGTSASPAFAGMLALVEQKTGSRLGTGRLRSLRSCRNEILDCLLFYDVTSGDNFPIDCTSGSPGCSEDYQIHYYFMTGYNAPQRAMTFATGLGSVNASQLVQEAGDSPSLISTASSLQLNGATSPISITHGQSVAVGAGVTSSDGTPTGLISLVDSLSPANRPNSEGIAV